MKLITCTECLDEIDVEMFGYHLIGGEAVCADCVELNERGTDNESN
jgi:hypothetical protein